MRLFKQRPELSYGEHLYDISQPISDPIQSENQGFYLESGNPGSRLLEGRVLRKMIQAQ